MSWTVDTFKTAMPAFENADDNVVQDALNEAVTEVKTTVFRNKTDSAVKWLTADLLALQGLGSESARINKDDKETVFRKRYERILNQVSYGLRVI